MIRRLLATVGIAAVLVAGAIVALEAVGLLFRKGAPAPVIAEVHLGEVPEETAPARLWKQLDEQELAKARAEEERRRQEAERHEAARQAEEAERKRPAEQKAAALGPQPVVDVAWQVEVQPVPEQVHEVKLTAVAAQEQGKRTLQRLSARPDGARSLPRPVREGSGRTRGNGCPFLGWLETVLIPPAPRKGAT
jgi:hypothetical protein